MRKIVAFLIVLSFLAACKGKKANEGVMSEQKLDEINTKAEMDYAKLSGTWKWDSVYQTGLQYCYGTVWAGDRLLISNYGGETLDPLGISGNGFIMQLKDGVLSEYIPKGMGLNSPKGMAVKDDYLYVADVNCILVFNMKDLKAKPQVIAFPENNLFVSDLAFRDNFLYASVRDAGLIYFMEITDPTKISQSTPDIAIPTVSGPNGITIYKDTMFICSYPVAEIGKDNSIYMVNNLLDLNPMLYKLESLPGYYCGIQYDPVSRMVYYTDGINGQLRSIDMNEQTNNNQLLLPEKVLLSPQMLTLANGKLYVPDVDASKLYVFTIPVKK